MLILAAALSVASAQEALPDLHAPRRPAVECAEHVRDDDARRDCLEDLLDNAEGGLAAAIAAAHDEAAEIDADFPGFANATDRLNAAHAAWFAYRDAECARRASLLLMGEDGEELALDCRIALTRARAAELLDN
ncbi:lysozyme inhibitor LprI family protein [Hyphobacterium marinum]|uniref:Lysozyme inhibitor LprI family protein n=1 Tax=Hyphobacterium marinum TaxID=3116574 RepID=A0ABU7LXE8_9PROT|nr:lysozyme inhibitor LprI family protein [Hyphobacterium sp. Y6023]MEE2566146.1 lysozyme inhibitor LprI family protein [Hyphobacterium sp. Y6023]